MSHAESSTSKGMARSSGGNRKSASLAAKAIRPSSSPSVPLFFPTLPYPLPPLITQSAPLVLSRIGLPPFPRVHYRKFTAAEYDITETSQQPGHALEMARRSVVATWRRPEDVLSSCLTTTQIEESPPQLWIFAIASDSPTHLPTDALRTLDQSYFDGLIETESGNFIPSDLFACCKICSESPHPCPRCTESFQPTDLTMELSSICLLPRRSHRRPYTFFLQALQTRLTDEICGPSQTTCVKYDSGFLLRPSQHSGDWSAGWDHERSSRRLPHCQLLLRVSSFQITIHPFVRPSVLSMLPPNPLRGTPLVLLPKSSPAYFISTYTGSTGNLLSAFKRSLAGHGAGEWAAQGFVVCWISLPDASEEGEIGSETEKGLQAVWPRSLCFVDQSRAPLNSLQSASFLDTSNISPATKKVVSYPPNSVQGRKAGMHSDTEDVIQWTSQFLDALVKDREKERAKPSGQRPMAEDVTMEHASSSMGIISNNMFATPLPLPPTPSTIVATPQPPIFPTDITRQFYPSPPEFTPSLGFSSQPTPATSDPPTQPMAAPPDPMSEYADLDSMDWNSLTFGVASGPSAEPEKPGVQIDALGGFGFITDDDLSFFDEPSGPSGLDFLAPSMLPDGSLFGAMPTSNSDPWGLGSHVDLSAGDFTISFATPHPHDQEPTPATALFLPSPAKSVTSPQAYMTPSLSFVPEDQTTQRRHSMGAFEPIPFADSHRVADGKYESGKFSLPSPVEEDPPSDEENHFRRRYDAVADPKVQVVRRLRGLRRRSGTEVLSTPPETGRPSWFPSRTPEDDSSSSSDEDSDVPVEDEPPADEHMTDDISRYSTPHPPSVPIGPALLHTHIRHASLLSLGTQLQVASPLSSAVVQTPIPMPISVPTPVSPGAALGSMAERLRILEAAVQVVVTEAIENRLWAEMCGIKGQPIRTEAQSLSQLEVISALKSIAAIPNAQTPLRVSDIADRSGMLNMHSSDIGLALEQLETPALSVAKAGMVCQVSTPALRFWEKLALGPLAGAKDVISFVLFEKEDEEMMATVEKWLDRVGDAYSAHGYGNHTPGYYLGSTPGLVPLRWETFKKDLANLLSTPLTVPHIVLYVLTPPDFLKIDSTPLRQLASVLMKVSKLPLLGYLNDDRILFQLVPLTTVTHSKSHSTTRGLGPLVSSVYNRLMRRTDRVVPRALAPRSAAPARTLIEAPAFTLARVNVPNPNFVLDWPLTGVDVVDRHTFLHVGYQLSPSREWLFASCIDQRGETHFIRTYLLSQLEGESAEKKVARQLVDFALSIARRVSLEWRLVFAKSGSMTELELDAWSTILNETVSSLDIQIHFTVVSVDSSSPLAFFSLPPVQSPPAGTGILFADVSSTTYALFVARDVLPPPPLLPGPPETANGANLTTPPDTMGPHPLSSAFLLHVTGPGDQTRSRGDVSGVSSVGVHILHFSATGFSTLRKSLSEFHRELIYNYHELAVLSRERWGIYFGALPFHLAAVQLAQNTLEHGRFDQPLGEL
ncbi:hypothetical protein BOTBODRAFT_188082 [Botryobasidium botryosum FD-172 SS1]|uniref:Mediator of RNA polymerase II transcription subunit 13 n=1 Tax=Botryobasidium botryosum (strain FD-172 SS1) TaxID=930990 RepID=A0A067MEK6_BOTB1|nr:hypothetical protein BOTBODRAFT_188082 [Botryobasidium botryosum FD-172 SS1]